MSSTSTLILVERDIGQSKVRDCAGLVIILFFSIFEKKKYFPQQLRVYYFQYSSGLWNTPYGKRHTSRTKPVLLQA